MILESVRVQCSLPLRVRRRTTRLSPRSRWTWMDGHILRNFLRLMRLRYQQCQREILRSIGYGGRLQPVMNFGDVGFPDRMLDIGFEPQIIKTCISDSPRSSNSKLECYLAKGACYRLSRFEN